MIRSMTGFGEARSERDGAHYAVELRSLNNKYFKATIRMPESLQVLEPELEAALRKRITRGTVTLTGACVDVSESAAWSINSRALNRYIEQLKNVNGQSGQSPDLGSLLSLPGVLQPPTDEEERIERARGAFLGLVDDACDALIEMRQREGDILVEELLSHRDVLRERLERIAERAPDVIAEYERRLQSRIETLLSSADAAVEPGDVIREVAVYAERTDIAEEIQRLRGHIEQFEELITSKEDRPVGRTLEFLAQEMLREANTIASKSPQADVSRDVVEIKGVIDRIKEQAHNVE